MRKELDAANAAIASAKAESSSSTRTLGEVRIELAEANNRFEDSKKSETALAAKLTADEAALKAAADSDAKAQRLAADTAALKTELAATKAAASASRQEASTASKAPRTGLRRIGLGALSARRFQERCGRPLCEARRG